MKTLTQSLVLIGTLVLISPSMEVQLQGNEIRATVGYDNISFLDAEVRQEHNCVQASFDSVVTIDLAIFESIFTLKYPLGSTEENITQSFFCEFKLFLIPFNWTDEDTSINVMKMTAEYNKEYFSHNSDDAIHLWVSFEPTKDITDDIDRVTDVINRINLIFPETITVVAINYNLLQLDRQSLALINHEILKLSEKIVTIHKTKNENLTLGLLLDSVNCRSRMEYLRELHLSWVDLLLFLPNDKNANFVSIQTEDDIVSLFSQTPCFHSIGDSFPAIYTHISIKVDLESGTYDYSRVAKNRVKNILNFSSFPFKMLFYIFDVYTVTNEQSTSSSNNHGNERNKVEENSSEFLNWLQQTTRFNKLHFGAVISSATDLINPLFENFRKILIEVCEENLNALKNLDKIVLKLVKNAISMKNMPNVFNDNNYNRVEQDTPIKIGLVVKVRKNDFWANKMLVDKAISAAVSGNRVAAGTITAIVIDWLPCTHSELCSSSLNKNLSTEFYCSYFKISICLQKLFKYTKTAVQKVANISSVSVEILIDEQVDQKIMRLGWKEVTALAAANCTQFLKPFLHLILRESPRACKMIVRVQELGQKGVMHVFNTVTAYMTTCSTSSKSSDTILLVKVVGCKHTDFRVSFLAKFTRFYEKLNNWAAENKKTIYVDAGVENSLQRSIMQGILPEYEGKCGWWVETNTSLDNQHTTILDKKELARRVHANKWKSHSSTSPNSEFTFDEKLLVWIIVPLLIFAIFITAGASYFIVHYQSKYIMTKTEVANFLKGRLQSSIRIPSGDGNEYAQSEKYNSDKYELKPSSFTIDTSSFLGLGEFGKVFRGTIRQDGITRSTAVKVANIRALGKSHGGRLALNGLLSEIKILSYLGEHNHIVGLLGAYTAKLRKGDISIFLELCEMGSLYKYLRSINPRTVTSAFVEDEANYGNIQMLDLGTLSNNENQQDVLNDDMANELYRYAGQIACGMEFLASKNVVHADLAARNVLLTCEKVAKISDFGLSRRMYEYSEYVKQNQAPLPWRWMAPESLRRMIFNEKTDVWAFGITLWEIFTLGDEPYPGLSYTMNFPAILGRGLQPSAPRYNIREIHALMKRCWNINPSDRPTFAELNLELQEDERKH